jgi:hypothetical protein
MGDMSMLGRQHVSGNSNTPAVSALSDPGPSKYAIDGGAYDVPFQGAET